VRKHKGPHSCNYRVPERREMPSVLQNDYREGHGAQAPKPTPGAPAAARSWEWPVH
jgi:hypothetical protein